MCPNNQKVMPKGMARAFRIRFWETFNGPGTYDILTDNQYKLPNSNDGCMQLRAPTTCPKWNEGMDEDIAVLHWLSKNAGLTSECVTEVIEPFAKGNWKMLSLEKHGMKLPSMQLSSRSCNLLHAESRQ